MKGVDLRDFGGISWGLARLGLHWTMHGTSFIIPELVNEWKRLPDLSPIRAQRLHKGLLAVSNIENHRFIAGLTFKQSVSVLNASESKLRQ